MCRFEFENHCPYYDPDDGAGVCGRCPYFRKYKKQTLMARIALAMTLTVFVALTVYLYG